jgi:hypothetical protein
MDCGTKGGVRLDAVEYNTDRTIKEIYDLKTGKAGLRKREFVGFPDKK